MSTRPRRVLRRTVLGALTAIAAVVMPLTPVHAADPDPVETTVTVSTPVFGPHAMYLLGESAPVSATVRATAPEGEALPGAPSGTVEFFDGAVSLGAAELEAGGADDRATATLETDRWQAGGARDITAQYTPDAESGFAPATSPVRVYRVVDTSRIIPDIALEGPAEQQVESASLEWTIANIWFANFNVGFEREVLGGNVSLPEMAPGNTIPERQQYFWRPFTFSEGTGEVDAAGNRIISFTGGARLTSGSGNEWNFIDPVMHISPSGDGYITAEFSGFYIIGERQDYDPVRVTIATFSGATLEADAEGYVNAEIELNWEGQANGPGTWALDHNDSFPNEFVALLNPGVSLFFTQSSVSTDDSKIPHPITLSFREGASPAITPEQGSIAATVGDAPVLRATVTGSPAPQVAWQTRTADAQEWTDVSEEGSAALEGTSATLELAAVDLSDDGRRFRVIAENDFGTATSEEIVLSVAPAVVPDPDPEPEPEPDPDPAPSPDPDPEPDPGDEPVPGDDDTPGTDEPDTGDSGTDRNAGTGTNGQSTQRQTADDASEVLARTGAEPLMLGAGAGLVLLLGGALLLARRAARGH